MPTWSMPTTDGQNRSAQVNRREVAVFLAIAFTLPWLLWFIRLLSGVNLIAAGGMVSVGLATLVTVRLVSRPANIRHYTALVPLRPVRRLARYSAAAFAGAVAIAFAAVAVGAVLGVYPTDLADFSGLRRIYAPHTIEHQGFPGTTFLTSLATNAGLFVILLPLAFCEEWGWRGFLLTRLKPLGLWPALLLSGLIWGLWHLPGYIGPGSRSGLAPFLIMTIMFGVLLGWLRLASGSIWPGVVAHAANNTLVTGFVNVVFSDASLMTSTNPWTIGLSGWPGWLVMLALIAALTLTGAVRHANERDAAIRSGDRDQPSHRTAKGLKTPRQS